MISTGACRFLWTAALFSAVVSGSSVATGQEAAAEAPQSQPAAEDQPFEFPDSWFMIDPVTKQRYAGWQDVEGFAAPKIRIEGWIANGIELRELRGKVVVVHFWSVECGPCLVQLRRNVELANDLADDDFVWLSIHDRSPARNRLPSIATQFAVPFPLGVDDMDATAAQWRVPAHPYYCVIDRSGEVRAVGVRPRRVDDVVRALLKEPFDPQKRARPRHAVIPEPGTLEHPKVAVIPTTWLESSDHDRRRLADELDLDRPPSPTSEQWLNSDPLKLEALKGKVVLLDFWATWCMPCRNSVPKVNAMYAKYKEHGLEIIGVCHPRGVERMAETVESWAINYPVVADIAGQMTNAYRVNGWPDYYVIDKMGRLRVIDCKNEHVEDVVKALLNEPDPSAINESLRNAPTLSK